MTVKTEASLQVIMLGCALYFGCPQPISAQDTSMGIRAEEVVIRLEKTNKPAKPPTKGPNSRRAVIYRPSKPFTSKPARQGMEYAQVGVTIWRLQELEGKKSLEQQNEEAMLEQVEASTTLNVGSRVRIGIESLTRDGFLYVIDREQFANGLYGVPQLIFPTLRTRKGNNRVRTNELILIPRPPSYLKINPSSTGTKQVAEVLTIIISPVPLTLPAPLTERVLTLDATQIKTWEKQWGATVNTLEMVGGKGQTTSVKTQDGTKSLDQEGKESVMLTNDDSLPQTIYRATIKRGDALLVTVPLRFVSNSVGKQN